MNTHEDSPLLARVVAELPEIFRHEILPLLVGLWRTLLATSQDATYLLQHRNNLARAIANAPAPITKLQNVVDSRKIARLVVVEAVVHVVVVANGGGGDSTKRGFKVRWTQRGFTVRWMTCRAILAWPLLLDPADRAFVGQVSHGCRVGPGGY